MINESRMRRIAAAAAQRHGIVFGSSHIRAMQHLVCHYKFDVTGRVHVIFGRCVVMTDADAKRVADDIMTYAATSPDAKQLIDLYNTALAEGVA